jgi:hypothetical protein
MTETAKIISNEANKAMVLLPNRISPAMCVHGDTLVSMAGIAHANAKQWILMEGSPGFPDELLDQVVYLSNVLVSMCLQYNEIGKNEIGFSFRQLNVEGLTLIDLD